MSAATIGALRVNLGLDSAQFTNGMSAAQRQLKSFAGKMQSIGNTMAGIGAGMSLAITGPLIAAGFAASKAAKEAAEAMGQVEAALASMGAVSGKTKEELAGLADGLMRSSLYDDDDILRKVTANLLTFGNVAGSQFDRAQQAAVDLATRMNMDLQPATLLIGKALNDPIKGLTALGRAGIQFTAAQKQAIQTMVAGGNAAGAQSIILGELERQFGGAAAAAQATDPYDRLRDSLNTLSESAGGLINRFLVPLMDKLAGLLDRFNALSPSMQKFIVIGGAIAAALGPALVVIGSLVSAVGSIAAALGAGGFLTGLLPLLGPIGLAVAAVAVAFMVFKDDIIPVMQDFGREMAAVLGPKLKPLFDAVKGLLTVLGKAFSAFFSTETSAAAENFKKFGAVIARVFGAAVDLITGAINVITNLMRAIGAALSGDWSTMWSALGSAVRAVVVGVINAFETLFPGVTEWVRKTYEGVKQWLAEKLFGILKSVIDKVKGVSDAFFRLYDAVVGHSYVPDMVEGIAEWMAKLDAGMVVPARNATDATASAFEGLRDRVTGIMDGLLTDNERTMREIRNDLKSLDDFYATGRSGMSEAQYQQARAGIDARGLQVPEQRGPLSPMADGRDVAPGALQAARERMNAAADEFGQRFGSAVESAINGDIRGAFESIFGDLRSLLSQAGRSLFQAFQSRGSGESLWSTLGRAASTMMGGSRLPAFASGGSMRVGGTGGIDSQVRSIRATPNETITVTKPGQFPAGGAMAVHVVPSPYFDVRVEKVSTPIAARAGMQSFGAARQQVPADDARRRRFSLTGA